MSYRDILLLRREARGWRLQDMGDEPPADPPLDPEFMSGIREEDPQVRQTVPRKAAFRCCGVSLEYGGVIRTAKGKQGRLPLL